MTNGNESAFPYLDGDGHLTMSEVGLSKREFFAALVLQGLMANPNVTDLRNYNAYSIADAAVTAADALIEVLNEVE